MKKSTELRQTLPDHAFRSIGMPDAELLLIKSELHSAIKAEIEKLGLSQKQAGEKLGWGQPDVSKVMNDRFVQHSVERLIKAALDLGLTVSFGVGAPESSKQAGRIAMVERAPKSAVKPSSRSVRRQTESRKQAGRSKQHLASHAAE